MMRRSNSFLSYYLKLCKLKQQLLCTSISEFNRSLGILARTFYACNGTHSKALMLYPCPLMQLAGTWS